MHFLGFFCSIIIGLSLGLIGGGGSMLTIPVLVYLLGIDPLLSTAYSLFVVGITSLVGSVHYIRRQQVHYRVVLLFSVPSFMAVFFIRRYVLPAIPDPIAITESVQISKSLSFMLLFAVIMLVAATLMIRGRTQTRATTGQSDYSFLILTGLVVGTLTGLVGIGGGFLIIPALVLLIRLPMNNAVGTSLLIITANSLMGFLSNPVGQQINWLFLLTFTALAVLGILTGSYLSRFISASRLRKAFGWSVLGLSLSILGKEGLVLIAKASPIIQPQPGNPTDSLWKAPSLSEAAPRPDSALIPYGQDLIVRTACAYSFPERQHKFGPFGPIVASRNNP